MAKKQQKSSAPTNFIDLRQDALKRNNNLVDDVIRPLVKNQRLLSLQRLGAILVAVIVMMGVVAIAHHHTPAKKLVSRVPAAISQAVRFPVYYPAAGKLPTGYTFNVSSFSAGSGAVLFTIRTANGQIISVSEQALPSAAQLSTFEQQRLPIYTNFTTPIGTARISAIGSQSFTSLPTNQTWLLISAPYAINQNQLNQVLDSLTT